MLNFSENFEAENDFITCSHLRDFAEEIGIDTGCAFGLSEDLEAEQLASIKVALQEAIEAEQAKLELEKRHACYIGPYEAGICTICGGRQP